MGDIFALMTIIALFVLAAWFKANRKKQENAKVQQQLVQHHSEARKIVIDDRKIGESDLFIKCCKILDGYEKIISNERFGKLVRTELQLTGPYERWSKAHVGAIKLIVERYSGDICLLLNGSIPNAHATPENYLPKYITLNHGEMYVYLRDHGFPEDFGWQIELYPSQDSDYAEWVVYLYEKDANILHECESWFHTVKLLTEKLKDQYPSLNVVGAVFKE